MADRSTVLVLGASRGLGLALAADYLARGWRVIATVRGPSAELEALRTRHGDVLEIERADLDDAEGLHALRARLAGRRIDILFVNAGICTAREETPATVSEADFAKLMLTNALGPVRAVELLEPLVPADGAIAVMSSELGSIAHNSGFWESYSASKAALNMLMKCFAGRHAGDPRALLLVAPGWIRTEMGGPGATYSIEQCIPEVAETVARSRGTPGLRFIDRHGRTLPW